MSKQKASDFSIYVAAGARSNNSVVLYIGSSMLSMEPMTFADAFAYCAEHMRSEDNLKLGNQVLPQHVVVSLSIALQAGIAELKNPLPMPIRKPAHVIEPTMTPTEVPASLHWQSRYDFPVHAFSYWDQRPGLLVVLGGLDGEILPQRVYAYCSNDDGYSWEEDGFSPLNEFYRKYVRMIEAYLATKAQAEKR